MSCCGRVRLPGPTGSILSGANLRRRGDQTQFVQFEYVGSTALTTVGPVTGQRYRFERPRARVAVDARDANAIAAVPNLRPIT